MKTVSAAVILVMMVIVVADAKSSINSAADKAKPTVSKDKKVLAAAPVKDAPPAPSNSPAPGAGPVAPPSSTLEQQSETDSSAGMPQNFHANVPGGANDPAGSMPMANDPEAALDIRRQVDDAPVDPNPPLTPGAVTPGAKAGEPGGPPMFYDAGNESTKPVSLRGRPKIQSAQLGEVRPVQAAAPAAAVIPVPATAPAPQEHHTASGEQLGSGAPGQSPLDLAEQNLNNVLNELGDVSGQIQDTETKLKGEEDNRAALLKKKSDLERAIGSQLRDDAQQMMEKSQKLMAEQQKFNQQSQVDQSYAGAQLQEEASIHDFPAHPAQGHPQTHRRQAVPAPRRRH